MGRPPAGVSWRRQAPVGPSGQVLVGPPELDEEEKPEEGEEDEDERVAFPDVEHGDLLVVAAGSLEHCRAAA